MNLLNNVPIDSVCEEIQEQLQLSLCRCVSNTKIYEYKKLTENLDMKECKNIQSYMDSLYATRTKIHIVPPIIKPNTKYVIRYNVRERSVTMDEFEKYFSLKTAGKS